jgi:uncharacterized membrane protein
MIWSGEALAVWLPVVLPVVLLSVVTIIVPALTVSTLQFGVRVPPQRTHAPVILQQRRAYFWRTGILAVCLIAAAAFVPVDSRWLTLSLVLVQLAGGLACYFLARERIIAVKDAEDWYGGLRQTIATDTSWRTDPERYPVLWLTPALLIIAATAVVGVVRYPHLPDQLAIHFSAGGTVDRYAAKDVWTAFALVVTQIAVTALLAGLLLATYRSRPEVDAADPAASTRRYRRFLSVMGRGMLALVALVDLSLMLVAFQIWRVFAPSGTTIAQWTLPVVVGVIVIVAIAIRMGQAGSRLRAPSPGAADTATTGSDTAGTAAGPTTVNRDDDRLWVGGLVYVNRRDPAIIVAKRYGVGWTFNFGNVKAWVVFVIVVGGAAALAIARRH